MTKFTPPSFKRGQGVAAHALVADAASAVSKTPATAPLSDVASRLGIRHAGEAKPKFDFLAPLKDTSEPELQRRRSMMRRTAARAYNQMGFSTKAHEASRAALLWLNQLMDTMDEGERPVGERLAKRLADVVEELLRIREAKIEFTADLEHALAGARQKMQTAKTKAKRAVLQDNVQGMGRPKRKRTLMPDEPHPGTAEPEVDITDILLGAGDEIRSKEAQKKSQQSGKKAVRDDGEKGTSRPSVEG